MQPYQLIIKRLIFYRTKDTKILLFIMEHYTMKIDIIRYYLFPNSTGQKLKPNIKLHTYI